MAGTADDHCPDPVDTVEVLGPEGPVLRRAGRELTEIRRSHVPAAIVAILAAEPAGVPAERIRALLTGLESSTPTNIQQHIKRLRKDFGVPIKLVGTSRGNAYQLDPRLPVDSFTFVAGVRGCPDPAAAEDLDPLLRAWRFDPRELRRIGDRRWFASTALFRARDELIRRVRALPAAERDGMASLADFTALFHDDPQVADIKPASARRPRVVVVDDLIVEAIIANLPTDVDYVRLRSLEEWRQFMRGEGLGDVQGILVDLHLTSGLRDSHGLLVADDVRGHRQIPLALMTVAPPGDQKHYYAKHRLLKIVFKGRGDSLNLIDLSEAVRAMVDDGDAARLERLRTNLDHCEFHVLRDHRLSQDKLRDFRTEVFRAQTAINDGDPVKAARIVDAVWTKWLKR